MSKLITIKQLYEKKEKGEKITMLTAYDATIARICEQAGVDSILVGDSLGMVIQGNATTVPVTIEDMIYHAKIVAKATPNTFKLVDMPFMSYTTTDQALTTARRLMQEGSAEILKLELSPRQIDIIDALNKEAVPVCAHLGLTPQQVYQLGGYRMLGKTGTEYKALLDAAVKAEKLGAQMILLECVPRELAKEITQSVAIPVIGIGAGPFVDGQVLVIYDVLGMSGYIPTFAKDFLQGNDSILAAISSYCKAVKSVEFPK